MTSRYTSNETNTILSKTFLQEIQSQCNIAIPTILGLVFYKIPWMISLHFVGDLGPESLAAAALATTLCNVTGMSFSVGLSSAITTLTGQARGHLLKNESDGGCNCEENREDRDHDHYGEDDEEEELMTLLLHVPTAIHSNETQIEKVITLEEKKSESTPLLSQIDISTNRRYAKNSISCGNNSPLLPLVFLYRGIIIQLAIVIPIGLWWIRGIEPILLLLGQAEKLSQMTTIYLKILTPGLWSYSINWTVTAWLQTLDMADIPAFAAFVGFILHVPFNILFVRVLGFGYEGVAMATVSFQLLQPLIIFFYLFGTENGRDRILTHSGAKAIGRSRLSFWPEVYAAISSFAGIKQYLELGM